MESSLPPQGESLFTYKTNMEKSKENGQIGNFPVMLECLDPAMPEVIPGVFSL